MIKPLNQPESDSAHVSNFASSKNGGIFKLATNDQQFMKKVAKVLMENNRQPNKSLSQGLSKKLGIK